jgi:hypothetical protein
MNIEKILGILGVCYAIGTFAWQVYSFALSRGAKRAIAIKIGDVTLRMDEKEPGAVSRIVVRMLYLLEEKAHREAEK